MRAWLCKGERTTTACPNCGFEIILLDEDAFLNFVDAIENPEPPNDNLKRLFAETTPTAEDEQVLRLSSDIIHAIRTALFHKAWSYPEDSSEESRWLAIERRIWNQLQQRP